MKSQEEQLLKRMQEAISRSTHSRSNSNPLKERLKESDSATATIKKNSKNSSQRPIRKAKGRDGILNVKKSRATLEVSERLPYQSSYCPPPFMECGNIILIDSGTTTP